MPKKPVTPPAPDIEFGIGWGKHPTHQEAPGILRSLRRRAWLARWDIKSANPADAVSRFEHRREIIRTLWPEHVLAYHYWTDRRIKSVAEHDFVMWMGGGGIGKTVDAAAIALEYWLEDPSNTAVIVCSTTKEMLRTRIWGQLVKLHSLLPREAKIGTLLDTACFIRVGDDKNEEFKGDWLNGIRGIAIQDGPVEEAISNLVGMHTGRVFVILDEAQGVREAIMAAIPNLLKNPESKMLIMGNPADFNSLLCRYGAPIDGWDSIPKFSEEWETQTWGYKGTGIGLYFDGYKSPAVLDPVWGKLHPWMTSQEQIDQHLWSKAVNGNENDPGFMVQTRGWPPSKGIEVTLLDASIVHTFHCQKPPVWTHGKTASGVLDPAYGGGDRAILQFGHRGWVEQEPEDGGKRWVIGFNDTIEIPIDAESETPIDHQIARYAIEQCKRRNIQPDEVSVLSAGRGAAIVSIMREEWGPVNAIEEGGAPSERKVGPLNKTAKEIYDTRASELGFLLREFALGNGIRGLPQKAEEQLCKRRTFNQKGKSCMEPKTGSKGRTDEKGRPVKGFKERLGYSPDHADACQAFTEHCRIKGATPGTGNSSPQAKKDQRQQAQEIDAMYQDGYAQEENWQDYAMNH